MVEQGSGGTVENIFKNRLDIRFFESFFYEIRENITFIFVSGEKKTNLAFDEFFLIDEETQFAKYFFRSFFLARFLGEFFEKFF